MTDVWKSNARRFCELCKVWFADNRVSIEHHEAGQKHKAAIQAKLRELGKQSKQREKEQSELQATLAMMETAASKSMGTGDSCPSAGMVGPKPKPKKYMDPRAHGASVAEMARQMAQRRKEQEHERKKAEFQTENQKFEPEIETVWVEARAENGTPYYFHMYSGVTVWEKPENYYTAEQYAMKLATMKGSSGAVMKSEVTEPNKLNSEPRRQWGQRETTVRSGTQDRRPAKFSSGKPLTENLSSKKVSSDVQKPTGFTVKSTNELPESSSSHQTVVKFEPEMDATNFDINECDIPLPPPPTQSSVQQTSTLDVDVKKEPSGNDDVPADNSSDTPKRVVDVKHEPEDTTAEKAQQLKPPKSSPYGQWVPVEKPPNKPTIDWELPTAEEGRKQISEPKVAAEDAVTFGDKSAPVRRKKIDGPIEFKKRKTVMKIRRPADEH